MRNSKINKNMKKETLQEINKNQPQFGIFIGMKVISISKEEVIGSIKTNESLSNRNGVMHGGAIMSFADNLAGTTTSLNIPENMNTTTIESKTNFLRAIPINENIIAKCKIIHNGNKTKVLETKIFREDNKLAAIVTQTQLIFEFKKT